MPTDSTHIVNMILNEIRAHEGISSDAMIGQHLGVSGQAIYRWRKGQITKMMRVLLPYAITCPRHPLKRGA